LKFSIRLISRGLSFITDIAFLNNPYYLFLQLTTVVVSLYPARSFKRSLVSVNGVFIETLNQLDLKLFRDLDLAVIPWWFVFYELLDLLCPVFVLDSVYRV
jgi:hypothetical protein